MTSIAGFWTDPGPRVIVTYEDMSLRIFDATNGEGVASFSVVSHEAPVLWASPSFYGEWVMTACEDGAAKVWDASNGQELLTLEGHDNYVFVAQFSPDSRRGWGRSGLEIESFVLDSLLNASINSPVA